MRLHTDNLTASDIYDAARMARADVELTTHGSRKRNRAFNVTLRGFSKRRPNSGNRGAADEYAATWDQWGVFLSYLFACDPHMFTPYDEDAEAFDARTALRFDPDSDNRADADGYWPADAHGDHRFEYVGIPFSQQCKKCSATNTWRS